MMHDNPIRFCDITVAYSETSGGIRTYIDQKRQYLLENTGHSHLLIIPGEEDRVTRQNRATTVEIASPGFPGQTDYRFFVWPPAIKQALERFEPDVIELGSYYITPWPVLSWRDERRAAGLPCTVGAFFHTDVAQAYVGAPMRALAHETIEGVSESLSSLVEAIADRAEARTENYVARIFNRCDLRIASTPDQAERLHAHGVEDVATVPLGVDLDLFHPDKRDEAVRRENGAKPGETVLLFVGRLDPEKHIETLIEAQAHLPADLSPHLWIIGDGPERENLVARTSDMTGVSILPYESDRARLASILASADIYITAGPHETFGLSVIEAQAAGLPVVGVEAGALVDRVVTGTGFLGPPDDAAAMAANIERAAAERERLSEAARAHVEQNFSWDTTFTRLMRAYEGIAGS